MSGVPEKLVTLYGECFEAELQSVHEYQERDGLLHKFHLTDFVSTRGRRFVSVFADWTLEATCANYKSRLGTVCINALRRAFDSGTLSFDAPFDEHHYEEISLSPEDFRSPQARTDGEVRQYIIHKAYWLAHRFPMQPQPTGILYPIPFDEPADLDYTGVTAPDIWRIIQRLANQGLLEKVLEGNARPAELLLSRYESGDRSALGLTARVPTGSPAPTETSDRKFARLAIAEARKSVPEDGRVHPRVGVVVVKDGRILASAHRGEIPQCHAEYIALEKKLADVPLSGAIVYTTLEPCTARNHPKVPCAIRLAERKVVRVLIGMLDPDDRISGRGQRTLRKAGIATELFPHDLMAEIEELNRDFIRDRESHDSHSQGTREDATASAPPKVRIALKRGHVSNFLIEYANDDDEPIFIREARLFGGKDGKIELTEPLTPGNPSTWRVAPHCSATFGKTIVSQRDPAASLVKMNLNKGIFFETEIIVVASCEMRGQLFEVRQTLYVKVNATKPEIVPLV